MPRTMTSMAFGSSSTKRFMRFLRMRASIQRGRPNVPMNRPSRGADAGCRWPMKQHQRGDEAADQADDVEFLLVPVEARLRDARLERQLVDLFLAGLDFLQARARSSRAARSGRWPRRTARRWSAAPCPTSTFWRCSARRRDWTGRDRAAHRRRRRRRSRRGRRWRSCSDPSQAPGRVRPVGGDRRRPPSRRAPRRGAAPRCSSARAPTSAGGRCRSTCAGRSACRSASSPMIL